MSTPLIPPSTAPHKSVIGTAAATGHFNMCITYNAQKSVRAKVDPTERSIPPTIMTKAMPSTTQPISPACRAASARAGGEKTPSIALLSAKATMISTITGIAVSVQRLASTSPSIWSGQ